jgi:predicted nucleic acid-binding protein
MIIISDTSCLIAFDRINQLEILRKTFPEIITTKEVEQEFGKTLPQWISVQSVANKKKILELETIIDRGEASAIALALETTDCILIIDEKKGRKIATELHIQIIGTLKTLLIAKQKGVINTVKEVIEELEKVNFRFSKVVVTEILKQSGES